MTSKLIVRLDANCRTRVCDVKWRFQPHTWFSKLKKILAVMMSCWLTSAFAQSEPFTYTIGAVSITEDQSSLRINSATPLTLAILPGGFIRPSFKAEDDGNLYVGGTIIDAKTGKVLDEDDPGSGRVQALPSGFRIGISEQRFHIVREGKSCRFSREQLGLLSWKSSAEALEDKNIQFAARQGQLLALAAKIPDDIRDKTYLINEIDVDNCRIRQTKLGNPDLLIELGRSRNGGWWLTGSIEQTLLRSDDGRRWKKVKLPKDISSLVSSYIVNKNEIWLAAIMPPYEEDNPLLVHTSDGGHTWTNVSRGDPLLQRIPDSWLEGKRRTAIPVVP